MKQLQEGGRMRVIEAKKVQDIIDEEEMSEEEARAFQEQVKINQAVRKMKGKNY